MEANNLYPVFIKLDQIQTLIVGGGNVALEKVTFILRQSPKANIKVIAKEFHADLIKIAIQNNNVKIVERTFVKSDLDGIKLLILATDDMNFNEETKHLAGEKNILTNVVDNPPLCDFYTSAVLRKGPVKIAVSSNGVSPTLAKRLRDVIADAIPNEVDESAELLNNIRIKIKGNLENKINTLNKVTSVLATDHQYAEKINASILLPELNLN